jgi:hypothetical protein
MPYAIFDNLTQSPADVEGLVVKELGPRFRLGGVMDLQRLGLKEWPCSRSGKLSIIDLKREVIKYLASKTEA